MEHVDVVVTDWLAGRETRVAVYTPIPGGPVKCVVRADSHVHLEGLTVTAADGSQVSPFDSDAYLAALRSELSSTYVAVSPLHDDEACPFQISDVIDMPGAATA